VRERHRRYLEERDRTEHANIRLLLAFALRPDDNCVDVGAHKGDILREIVRIAPHGHHVAYEPLEPLCHGLAQEFPAVDVRCAAVSDHRGREPFLHVVDEPALSSFHRLSYHQDRQLRRITVPVEDLDSSLPDRYRPALIKIDAEGAEVQVVAGALQTIRFHRPVVIVEFTRDAAASFGTEPDDLFDLLCGAADLRLFDIEGNGPLDRTALRRVVRARRVQNFVAHV
jgi:FkbM family methyltransferase